MGGVLTLHPCVLRDVQLCLTSAFVPPYLLLESFEGMPLLDSTAITAHAGGGQRLLSNYSAPDPTRLLVLTLTLEVGIL